METFEEAKLLSESRVAYFQYALVNIYFLSVLRGHYFV